MKIEHSAILEPVFELIKTVEIRVKFGTEIITYTIGLFQNTEDVQQFRARIWDSELFRLTPTFPQDREGNSRDVSDEHLMVERFIPHTRLRYDNFKARTPEHAIQKIFNGIKSYVRHVTNTE